MAKATILIVEDEPAISTLIQFTLTQAGFHTLTAADVETARRQINAALPHLILLDWMLPTLSGIEFTQELRSKSRTRDIPIILLTARSDEDDKEQGLNIGADDYITKPFSPRELVARINALLRRLRPHQSEQCITRGGLTLDPLNKTVTADGKILTMGATELKLLHFFMTHPNRLYSRTQLLDLVWGDHVFIEERTVDVHIRRLRQSLTPVGLAEIIQTVRGAGYKFHEEA